MIDFEQWTSWPEWAKDAVISDTRIRFGWKDRLLILIGRPLMVTSKTWTEVPVGRTQGIVRSNVPEIRWPWSRRSFGVAEARPKP